MRFFGRSKITKASPAGDSKSVRKRALDGAAAMSITSESYALVDLAVTDEMPIVRDFVSYPSVASPDVVESQTGADDGDEGNSDVFVCRRSAPEAEPDAAPGAASAAARLDAEIVTLFVYGWENVEPGPLSWAFPSLRAALDAVKTMRNAIEWCIVAGHEWSSIDAARESGAVLIEQNA